MPRPVAYLDELAECAKSRTSDSMIFERNADCYQQLKAKYARYQPTADDIVRAESHRREMLEGKVPADMLDELLKAFRSGCHGCLGRDIRA
jgi:hypothetical protein